MKLFELIDTKLSYNDTLNPKLWDIGEIDTLNLKVLNSLMKISTEFAKYLKIPDSAIIDYVFTGSNANYNWTEFSDIDIHLLIDYDQIDCDGKCNIEIEDCLLAKKSLWNNRHDITIYGHEVEVYASDSKDQLVNDSGCYSILKKSWIKRPIKKNIKLDSLVINKKVDEISSEINQIINSKTDDENIIKEILDKLWKYRQSGLSNGGEFSIENLVFKSLRNNGFIDKIRKYSEKINDKSLSLENEKS